MNDRVSKIKKWSEENDNPFKYIGSGRRYHTVNFLAGKSFRTDTYSVAKHLTLEVKLSGRPQYILWDGGYHPFGVYTSQEAVIKVLEYGVADVHVLDKILKEGKV